MDLTPQALLRELASRPRFWLFLDYDGTLAEFEPTPDEIHPRAAVIAVVTRLARLWQRVRPVILSGRSLAQIRRLVPVEGILLAGNYGIEYLYQGREVLALDLALYRPVLERVKLSWQHLLRGQPGFFLEDKTWALAIHAKDADPRAAGEVLPLAQEAAQREAAGEPFRILAQPIFLEISPLAAQKSAAVPFFLQEFPWPGAGLVYLGDDDRDEEALAVVRASGGWGVLVGPAAGKTQAHARLESPAAARSFLNRLAAELEGDLS